MSAPNYVGETRWYIVTVAGQVTIPEFTFSFDNAPYLIGQIIDGRIFVFDRANVLEIIDLWQAADSEMKAR